MKMGTTASLWHYDRMARNTPQSVELRRLSIWLHARLSPDIATWSAYPFDSGYTDQSGIDVMCHWRPSGRAGLMLAPYSTTGGVCANRPL